MPASATGRPRQLTADGCLMNAWNSDLVLTAGLGPDGDLDGTVWVFPLLSSPSPPNQTWVVPERGVLVSRATRAGQSRLRADGDDPERGGAGGAQLTMAPYTAGSPAPGQQWELFQVWRCRRFWCSRASRSRRRAGPTAISSSSCGRTEKITIPGGDADRRGACRRAGCGRSTPTSPRRWAASSPRSWRCPAPPRMAARPIRTGTRSSPSSSPS